MPSGHFTSIPSLFLYFNDISHSFIFLTSLDFSAKTSYFIHALFENQKICTLPIKHDDVLANNNKVQKMLIFVFREI